MISLLFLCFSHCYCFCTNIKAFNHATDTPYKHLPQAPTTTLNEIMFIIYKKKNKNIFIFFVINKKCLFLYKINNNKKNKMSTFYMKKSDGFLVKIEAKNKTIAIKGLKKIFENTLKIDEINASSIDENAKKCTPVTYINERKMPTGKKVKKDLFGDAENEKIAEKENIQIEIDTEKKEVIHRETDPLEDYDPITN